MFPESCLVDLRIKNYFKDYLFWDIRTLTTERDEKGARKLWLRSYKYRSERGGIRLLWSPLLSPYFSRLQLELTRTRTRGTRTRTRWTRGILSTWMKNWNPSFDSVEEVCLLGLVGFCIYCPLRWIWAVGSNRHWLNGYPWSFRSVEHDPRSWPWYYIIIFGGKRGSFLRVA